jgi:hypothetical protein
MDEQERVSLNDYLSAIRANNPGLTDYWPGAKRGQPAKEPPRPAAAPTVSPDTRSKATSVKAGCLPCSLGHMGACSGMLQEAVRFAQSDGVDSDTPIDRINTCLDELNTLERKDLTPELIESLPPWERELALKALAASRSLRHSLEGIETLDDLIAASAKTTTVRKEIGREWFRKKFVQMTPREQKHLAEEALERFEKEVKHA